MVDRNYHERLSVRDISRKNYGSSEDALSKTRKDILETYKTHTAKQVADIYGVSEGAVRYAVKKAAPEFRKKNFVEYMRGAPEKQSEARKARSYAEHFAAIKPIISAEEDEKAWESWYNRTAAKSVEAKVETVKAEIPTRGTGPSTLRYEPESTSETGSKKPGFWTRTKKYAAAAAAGLTLLAGGLIYAGCNKGENYDSSKPAGLEQKADYSTNAPAQAAPTPAPAIAIPAPAKPAEDGLARRAELLKKKQAEGKAAAKVPESTPVVAPAPPAPTPVAAAPTPVEPTVPTVTTKTGRKSFVVGQRKDDEPQDEPKKDEPKAAAPIAPSTSTNSNWTYSITGEGGTDFETLSGSGYFSARWDSEDYMAQADLGSAGKSVNGALRAGIKDVKILGKDFDFYAVVPAGEDYLGIEPRAATSLAHGGEKGEETWNLRLSGGGHYYKLSKTDDVGGNATLEYLVGVGDLPLVFSAGVNGSVGSEQSEAQAVVGLTWIIGGNKDDVRTRVMHPMTGNSYEMMDDLTKKAKDKEEELPPNPTPTVTGSSGGTSGGNGNNGHVTPPPSGNDDEGNGRPGGRNDGNPQGPGNTNPDDEGNGRPGGTTP